MRNPAVVLGIASVAACRPATIRDLPGASAGHVDVYVVDPTSAIPILPTTDVTSNVASELAIEACRDEIASTSFVLRAAQDLHDVRFHPSDLVDRDHVIPPSAIDIKVVKVWYQAKYAWRTHGRVSNDFSQVLVPALLLHDESIIEVDRGLERNYLKIGDDRQARRRWVNPKRLVSKDYTPSTMYEFPFADAAVLRAVSLTDGENKQFWMSVHVPRAARPGSYRGRITITAGSAEVAQLSVQLEVLPFALEPSTLTYSIYYRGVLDPKKAGISSEYKTESQMRAELADMVAHGVGNPTVYQSADDLPGFAAVLKLRNELGMSHQPLYLVGLITDDARLGDKLRNVQSLVQPFGVPDVYVYGLDEATGQRLLGQRAAWAQVHDHGAKIFVAGYEGTFEAMGDLLDMFVHAWRPSSTEAAKWHGAGHAIVSYDNPQSGPANPHLWRQNYGVVLWAAGYDGAMPYAYQHCFGDCYDDLDDKTYRDHLLAYPTVDGVIDTIAWEGFREGVYDVRYIQTLETQINAVLRDGDAERRDAAREAQDYLQTLKKLVNACPTNGLGRSSQLDLDLGAMRRRVIAHLARLRTRP